MRQIKNQLSPSVDEDFIDNEFEMRKKEIEDEILQKKEAAASAKSKSKSDNDAKKTSKKEKPPKS